MSAEHPKLTAARAALEEGGAGVGPIIALAFGARAAQDEGRYCECPDPILTGNDLMCGACLLNNKDQERKRCAVICNAHEFVPWEVAGFCGTCARGEADPRHHGIDAAPRYSKDGTP